jgi:hypothetical protein
VHPDHAEWPESWQPRIRVLTTTDTLNPTVAECADCGETWERPDGDAGSNTLPVWAAEHECNRQAPAVHLSIGERA